MARKRKKRGGWSQLPQSSSAPPGSMWRVQNRFLDAHRVPAVARSQAHVRHDPLGACGSPSCAYLTEAHRSHSSVSYRRCNCCNWRPMTRLMMVHILRTSSCRPCGGYAACSFVLARPRPWRTGECAVASLSLSLSLSCNVFSRWVGAQIQHRRGPSVCVCVYVQSLYACAPSPMSKLRALTHP